MMVSSGRRARTRLRNRRAVATVIGLVAVAALCIFGLVSGFGGVGASRSAHPKKKKVVHARLAARPTSTAPAAVPTTTAPAPATPSTSTPPTTARTTSTTVRRPPPTTVAPPVPVPSTLPAATAFASATNLPEFCTVTVHVSTGAAQQYPLAAYVQNVGDLYTFTAYVGGYKVQVTANVVEVNHAAACQPTLANLSPV